MGYRLATIKWIFIAYLTMLSMSLYAYARGEPSEDQVKAAFVFNFAKFVDWPAFALKTGNTLNLCIAGKDKTTEALKQLGQREVQGHLLHVINIVDEADPVAHHGCHVLFIGISEKKRQQQWLAKVQNQAVLTIADNLEFIKEGGMISLYTEDQRVQFVVNQSGTQGTGLKLSARMLQLARVPRE
jgi:hypothetical protein